MQALRRPRAPGPGRSSQAADSWGSSAPGAGTWVPTVGHPVPLSWVPGRDVSLQDVPVAAEPQNGPLSVWEPASPPQLLAGVQTQRPQAAPLAWPRSSPGARVSSLRERRAASPHGAARLGPAGPSAGAPSPAPVTHLTSSRGFSSSDTIVVVNVRECHQSVSITSNL